MNTCKWKDHTVEEISNRFVRVGDQILEDHPNFAENLGTVIAVDARIFKVEWHPGNFSYEDIDCGYSWIVINGTAAPNNQLVVSRWQATPETHAFYAQMNRPGFQLFGSTQQLIREDAITTIKMLRMATGLGLKEAKDMVVAAFENERAAEGVIHLLNTGNRDPRVA